MKIAFFIGWAGVGGGANVIYEHAAGLNRAGHQVFILSQKEVPSSEYQWHPSAASLSWVTIAEAGELFFDVVIATWWESPFLLKNIPSSHYVYFVQSIETRFFESVDPTHHDKRDLDLSRALCESSYTLNIPYITEARWIREYLKENYNHNAFLVPNGIDKNVFKVFGETIASRIPGKLRVLVEGPVEVFHKNVIRTIELCHEAEVDEIWLLTSSQVTDVEGVDKVFSQVPIQETPPVYRSCDVLVKLSLVEGMFGPPLEMFHCGGTAIVYDVTGHDEYIINNENGYVVKTGDDRRVVDYLVGLKNNPEELKRLKGNALKTASQWLDWQGASGLFHEAVNEIAKMKPASRQYFSTWTDNSSNQCEVRSRDKELKLFLEREIEGNNVVRNNFIQVYYWSEKEGLSPHNFSWAHYQGGVQNEISIEIPVIGYPFWVRLDPSVHIGVLEIFSIYIRGVDSGETFLSIDSPETFNGIKVGEHLHKVVNESRALFFSRGNDPQIFLPAISGGKLGENIELVISFKESGVLAFMKEMIRSSNKEQTRQIVFGKLKRLKQRLMKYLNP